MRRCTKSQVGYISPIWGADPFGQISTKIGKLVWVHDLFIQSKFGFNILIGFRPTRGQNFRFPIDFAGHRYNSAAATAQPVILLTLISYTPLRYVRNVVREE